MQTTCHHGIRHIYRFFIPLIFLINRKRLLVTMNIQIVLQFRTTFNIICILKFLNLHIGKTS